MKNSPIRIVIIGAGFFGSKRVAACLKYPRIFRVVAIIDPSEEQRKRIETTYHLPVFARLGEFDGEADAAIVATPNTYHKDSSIEAMKRGMHVLCEKPLATTVLDAQRIAQAAKKYKRIVKTGSNHRFFRSVQKAKELFDNGRIGRLLNFRGTIGTNGSRVSRKWFWNKQVSGGGTLIDNGPHLLDIARMFMGDFASVIASMETNLWKTAGVEDMAQVLFRTKDERVASITASWYQWTGYLHIELWGEKGYIIIDSSEGDTVTVGGPDGTRKTYDFSKQKKDSYERELLYFADCIRKQRAPEPNATDGAYVLAMIESAYLSSRTKMWQPIKRAR